jgi:hypothetical protein
MYSTYDVLVLVRVFLVLASICYVLLEFLRDAINVLFSGVCIFLLQRACCVKLRTEGIVPLWSELFLLLSCSRFVVLVEVSGESCYRVVRLLLGGVDYHAHGLGLTLEGQRGTLTEEESDRGRLDFMS